MPLSWETDERTPLTMRLNNPGAIEFGPFASRRGGRGGQRFARFDTPEAGWRAMDDLLGSYRGRGLNTVAGVINRWAPRRVDNNSTGSYIDTVSRGLGIGANDVIPDNMWSALAEHMASYEAGRRVTRPGAAFGAPQPEVMGWFGTSGDGTTQPPPSGYQPGAEGRVRGLTGPTGWWGRQPGTPPPPGDNRLPPPSPPDWSEWANMFPGAGSLANPPGWQTEINPSSEVTTADILERMPPGSPSPNRLPPGREEEIVRGANRAAADRPPPPPEAAQPGYMDRLLNNRAFLMGLSILGTAPGGNWGPNAVQSALAAQKSRREETEFERLQSRRTVMDRVWREAFPNGQPNVQHPLLRDVPPEMLSTIYALGPDVGLPELQRYAFARGQQDLQLRQRQRLLQLFAGEGGTGTTGTTGAAQPPGGAQPPPPGGAPPPGGGEEMQPVPPGFFGGTQTTQPPGGAEFMTPNAGDLNRQLGLGESGLQINRQPPQEPMVNVFGRRRPLTEAVRMAQMLDAAGMRSEPLEKEIAEARASARVPADQAGRVAMIQTARSNFGDARRLFERSWTMGERLGNATGVAWIAQEYDQARRTVRLAVEATLRAMTGQAAPESEVTSYMDMFMPSRTDPVAIAKQKLRLLEMFMGRFESLIQAPGSNDIGNFHIERVN